MDRIETEKIYNLICQDVYHGKIKSALDNLSLILRNTRKPDSFYELETIKENYQNLLKYSFQGYHDPKQEEILNQISASIISLANEVRLSLNEIYFPQMQMEKRLLAGEFGEDPQITLEKLDELLSEIDLQSILEDSGAKGTPARPVENIFRLIWLTFKMNEEIYGRLQKTVNSGAIEWYDKSLLVSALTISLMHAFDSRKINLLLDFINAREHQVFQRALTGLVMVLIRYDQQVHFYPDLTRRIKALSDEEKFTSELETLILQLLMAQETEKITREFEEEVLPEMKKMIPRIEDKLQLGNLLEEDDMEGKNPGWKDMFQEVPGLFERIEKFTKMQMEGGDVFMSTFSLLKRFDFFNRISSWVVPFYPDHPELKKIRDEGDHFFPRLVDGLDKAFYLCNSDKYSFALNFSAIPQQQRSMLVTYFEAELEQMKEMASEEEKLNPVVASNSVFVQYIQDLYRFFKLYPNKNEFDDFFRQKILISKYRFYRTFFETPGFTERLAIFYFEKEYYEEAIELYKMISEQHTPSGVYFEKIGYSYQKIGNFAQAIEYYKKAELFEGDRLWILKKLGWCSLKLKDYRQAASYFEEASKMNPEDLTIKTRIAQCYMNLKEFSEALHHYAKVSFYQPENMKVMRPVAYCHFVLGNLQEAQEIYSRILNSDSPTLYDRINTAHVLLCLNRREEALGLYRLSLATSGFTSEQFITVFEEDTPYLINHGISRKELPLLVDYILYNSLQ